MYGFQVVADILARATDSNSLLREVAGEMASSQGGFEGLIPSGHTLTERTLPYLAIETGIKHWVNSVYRALMNVRTSNSTFLVLDYVTSLIENTTRDTVVT